MSIENIKFNCLDNFIKNNTKAKLVLNGFLAPLDLFLIKSILKNNKKVLYITNDEQSAFKAQKDLDNFLKIDSCVYPMQEIGFYSELEKNYYIYEEQVNAFLNQPSVVFASVKALFEKFASMEFYKENIIEFKKNDSLDYSKIAQKLVDLGYKRVVNVVDIGEFALRGDILDIYSLDLNPVRIEFFADTIEDIRQALYASKIIAYAQGFDEISNADKYKERFVIERYTGLTDKHGNKIFEGDILKVCRGEDIEIGYVIYDERMAAYSVSVTENDCLVFIDWFIAKQEDNRVWIEVIGNIHDNPKLLNSQ